VLGAVPNSRPSLLRSLPGLLAAILACLLTTWTHAAPAKKKSAGKKDRTPASQPKRRAASDADQPARPTRADGKRRSKVEAPATQPRRARKQRGVVEETRSARRRGKVKAKPQPDLWPPMKLEAVNGRLRETIRLYDRRGRTVRASVRKVWHLMRCHLTSKERPIHWRLLRSLYRISRRYPGKTIHIYSGYRAKRVANLPNSNHVKGRAMDIHVDGVSNKALRDYLIATFKPAGVGYYPNAPFVHFDVREKQSAFWVDSSGKGEAAEYAANPYQLLREERKAAKKAAAPKGKQAARPAKAQPVPASQPHGGDASEEPSDAEPATAKDQPTREKQALPAGEGDEDSESPATGDGAPVSNEGDGASAPQADRGDCGELVGPGAIVGGGSSV
jgi:uncharacterized protein YcbK (DUF882 family)